VLVEEFWMTEEPVDRQTHWQKVHRTRTADSVSWYRPHLDVSIELLERARLSVDSRVIDIGGGASTLVDDLLDRGLRGVSVLDVSAEALAIAQKRLGDRGGGRVTGRIATLEGDHGFLG
jgi:hypothetical protein